MHISPELSHHDNDNHTETAQVHMSCVDHESSTFSNSKDMHIDLLVGILPDRFEIVTKSIDYTNTDSEVTIQEVKPPDKIALYIKNNVFRL